ncbi:MAG: DedA family protein [bacterium]|nr:DedA family protein [Patescibacteria group bacterium]MDW8279824.1 DedA family protein [bacterium]
MEEYLFYVGQSISYYKYLIVLILSIIEGPVVMTLSGMLWKLNYFSFLPLYLALMTGDLIADTFWYYIGYFGGHNFIKKYGKYFSISEEKLDKFKIFFNKHQSKILFLSKVTMGFGLALFVLIAAGISRISFKKYITINFLGQIIWTLFLVILGYFFGTLYLLIDKSLRIGFVILVILVSFILIYGLNYYMKRNIKI